MVAVMAMAVACVFVYNLTTAMWCKVLAIGRWPLESCLLLWPAMSTTTTHQHLICLLPACPWDCAQMVGAITLFFFPAPLLLKQAYLIITG